MADHTLTLKTGRSVDSIPSNQAWAEKLGGISYPLLSDFEPKGQVSRVYGVYRPEGYSERAIVVVDKDGIVRYIDVHGVDQVPPVEDILRVLQEI